MLCYCFPSSLMLNFSPLSSHWMGQPIEATYFSWHLELCVWKAESQWLRERDLPLTCYENMSRRMGDKGVLGRGCQQKWISAGEDTTHATVQWFSTSWHLFTTTTFQTLLCVTLSEIMHSSEPTEFTWVMKSVLEARVKNVFLAVM